MEDISIMIGSDGVITGHGNVPFSCKEKERFPGQLGKGQRP